MESKRISHESLPFMNDVISTILVILPECDLYVLIKEDRGIEDLQPNIKGILLGYKES